jgi:uncharacterized protein
MTSSLPAWAEPLGLQPHPEGGWFAETYRAAVELPASALPPGYDGPRALATSIVFVLLPGEESAWHVVRSDELWVHQRGAGLVLGLGGNDSAGPGAEQSYLLGTSDLRIQRPQLLVPAGTWQTARPAEAEAVMVACFVAPGFAYSDWRLAGTS